MLQEELKASGAFPAQKTREKECWFWAGWEPDRFYTRIGARSTSFFGNGDWIPDWRLHLESDPCLESLLKVGATHIVTRFYKGFGPAIERGDWASLKAYIERAHQHGIKVWGYFQGRSLFGEFLYNEFPQARDWVAQNFDGTPQTWGGSYNRFAPCLNHPDFLAMMQEILREGICSLGLDGFHMDNNYYNYCYCPRCKAAFRDWLTSRLDLEKITGFVQADFVEPPPLQPQVDVIPDPVAILWIEYSVQVRLRFMKAIRKTASDIDPAVRVMGNPAFMRSFASRLTYGFDPSLEHEVADAVCIENGSRPRYAAGILFTQADKHLFAEAGSLRTWVTSWGAPAPGGGYQPPLTPQAVWAGLAEEFSFQNAYLGNNWALRPSGEGDGFLKEAHPGSWAAFQEGLTYFQKLECTFGGEARTQFGELVLYIDPSMISLAPSSDAHVLQAVIARLLVKNIPFKMVYPGRPLPKEARFVLICGQRCMAQSELIKITRERQIAEVWLLGECAIYSEWCVPRSARGYQELVSHQKIRSWMMPLAQWLDRKGPEMKYFNGATPTFSVSGIAEVDRILESLAARLSVQISAPEGVVMNIEASERSFFIHLRDLREEACGVEDSEVTVTLGAAFSTLRLYSPSGEAVSPALSQFGTAVPIAAFRHYALLVAEISTFGDQNQNIGKEVHCSLRDG